jgi:hypothetical protein
VEKLTPTLQKAAAARDYEALADVYLELNSAGLLAISDLRMLRPPAAAVAYAKASRAADRLGAAQCAQPSDASPA